jgi:uncharacterized iron-regulated membrane protein
MAYSQRHRMGSLGQSDITLPSDGSTLGLDSTSFLVGLSIAIVAGTLAGIALRPTAERLRRRVRRARSAQNPVWQTLVLTVASGVATGLIINHVEKATQ